MLKKLVKYGNSQALLLDRAILELLNIREGSVLKLRIEGDTLLIKAADMVKPTDSLMLEVESLHNQMPGTSSSLSPMMEEQMRRFCKKLYRILASTLRSIILFLGR